MAATLSSVSLGTRNVADHVRVTFLPSHWSLVCGRYGNSEGGACIRIIKR